MARNKQKVTELTTINEEDVTMEETTMNTTEPTIEVVAPIIAKAMEAITAVVADSISVNQKWALLLDIMAKTDESALPIEQCSQAELNRRLKLLASKKTAEKKISETSDAFKAIVAQEEAIKALKVNIGRSSGSTSASYVGKQPEEMDSEQLTAYIRGLQGKKSTLKKVLLATPVGSEAYETVNDQMKAVIELETAAIACRATAPASEKAPKTKKLSKETETKINIVLASLLTLEQTPEVEKQVAALRDLLG
jgi:hypothetical protein